MRIALLGIRGIPARYGGFETNAEITAQALVERGHEVVVYCRGSQKDNPRQWKGIKLTYLPSVETKNLSTISHTLFSVLHSIFRKFDVVHMYNVGNAFFIPMLRIFGKKVVMSVDGVEWRRKKYGVFSSAWMHLSERVAQIFANKIIVDSHKVGEYYKSQYNTETEYIPYGSKIYNGGPKTGILEEYGLEPQNYMLFVGRFMPEKGVDKLLESFRKVKTDMPLVVVGDNPYDKNYVKHLKEIAPENTLFTGSVYNAPVAELYVNSYLFVSPSELEGTSPALLEAMGAGTCVVVNGIPEQLETVGDSGVHYRVNDLDDLTRKMQHLVDNREYRDAMAKKAQERVGKNYRWETAVDHYEFLLKGIAGVE